MNRPPQLLHAPSQRSLESTARELVVTGCGRVYSFPESLPQSSRAAGLNHYDHRFGYVEPSDDQWQARDLRTHPLGAPQSSRVAAIRTVILQAGLGGDAATFSRGASTPTGVHVRSARRPQDPVVEVYLSVDSRLHVVGGSVHPTAQFVGSIWPTRLRFASLAPEDHCQDTVLHRARNAAITHLIENAGYERVPSTGRPAGTPRHP